MDNPESVKVAERCIESGKKFGVDIEMFQAITPKDDAIKTAESMKILTQGFREKFSRFERCLSAYLSHFSLWNQCYLSKEEFQIFEHDAIIVDRLPGFIDYKGCISLGKPSYGRFMTPKILGVNPLTSKAYFPGAHAYRIKPQAAQVIMDEGRLRGGPTDVFFHKKRFPFLEEYYPWPVEVDDTFTTIQTEIGIRAKHNYSKGFKIL